MSTLIDAFKIYQGAMDYAFGSEHPVELKEEVIKRHMVNHIRHVYTPYDVNVKGLHDDLYFLYKSRVLRDIASKYNFLSDECNRQRTLVNMVKEVKK